MKIQKRLIRSQMDLPFYSLDTETVKLECICTLNVDAIHQVGVMDLELQLGGHKIVPGGYSKGNR